MDSVQT